MAKANEETVRVTVLIIEPPLIKNENPAPFEGAMRFGMELVGRQTVDGRDMRFDADIRVTSSEAGPKLAGPYVQGNAGDRHLKIAWGQPDSLGHIHTQRAVKVPLKDLSPALILEARTTGRALVATISGKAKDDLLACATVPLLAPWRLE